MSLNKYSYHTANIIHTVIIQNEHIDPAFLYIYTKIQPNAAAISCIITYMTAYTSQKNHKLQLLPIMLLPYMCQQQKYLSNAT